MDSFIGHTDTLLNFYRSENYDFQRQNDDFQVDLPRLRAGRVKIQVFAVYVEPEYKAQIAMGRTLQIIDQFYQLVEQVKELELIRNYSDVEKILQGDKIGALLAIEGADSVFDLSALRTLYRLGVRLLSLTWNQRNQLADGIEKLEADGGVTRLGREVIAEMNRLGMIIDVSHLSPRSFWDVIKFSKKPVIASHSNASGICPHPRNLSDDQLQAIAAKGGHIGLNFAPEFLTKNKRAKIDDVIRHIDYIRELVGIESISLGTDYDGISTTPEGLEDISKLPQLARALLDRGYSKEDIAKIFKNNWVNFLKQSWSES